MFFNALQGNIAVRDEIERVVDPQVVPDDADWDRGIIYGTHVSTRKVDFLNIENHSSLLGGYNVQAYRDEIDTLMGDYSMTFGFWLGFVKNKAVRDWLDYMQWLTQTIAAQDPTSGSFASRQTVSYNGQSFNSEMVVLMFKTQQNMLAFMQTHGDKDYRFDGRLGMKAWRA